MSPENHGVNPELVTSPKSQWQLIDIVYECAEWSIAIGKWKETEWRPVLVMRWNGVEGGKGNPVSHGYPTWFVLPDETYKIFIDSEFIPSGKRPLVRELLKID